MVACKECSRNRNEDDFTSPMAFCWRRVNSVSSMTLVLPTRSAPQKAPLIQNEVEIKDTNGRCWTVESSYTEGRLTFGRGWRVFVQDHGIVKNDIVFFYQISSSEFICEIFGSRGAKKWQFPSASQDTESSDSTEKCLSNANTIDSNVDRRWVLVPSEYELYKISNGNSLARDVGYSNHAIEADMRMPCDSGYSGSPIHGENFGSGGFPSTAATIGAEHKRKHSATFPDTTPCQGPSPDTQYAHLYTQTSAFQGQTTNVTGPAMEAQTVDFNGQTTTPSDQGGRGRTVNEQQNFNLNSFGGIAERVKHKHYYSKRSSNTQTAAFQRQTTNVTARPAIGAQTADFNGQTTTPSDHGGGRRIVKEQQNFNPNSFVGIAKRVKHKHDNSKRSGSTRGAGLVKKEPMVSEPQHIGSSRGAGSLKKEPMEFKPQDVGASNSYRVLKKVKTEAEDFTQPRPAVTCAVTSDSNYLELPKGFSSLKYSTNRNVEKEVDFLMDPAGRLWPVMWCRISDQHILTRGWKSIRYANGIRTGDECVFSREDDEQGIIMMEVILK